MIFFEDAISWDEPVTQNVIYFLGGPPSMVFPVWKQEKNATFKTRLMEAFPTTQIWMGRGKKM
jgi:hypothetical protein